MSDLIERLSKVGKGESGGDEIERLESKLHEQAKEIGRLTAALEGANANHEHFERGWYLRGDEIEAMQCRLGALQTIVDAQAKDEGLWFQAATAPEGYLQQELRKLHAAIEEVSPEECARRVVERQEPK